MPLAPWEVRREVMKSMERANRALGGSNRKPSWIQEHMELVKLGRIHALITGRRIP